MLSTTVARKALVAVTGLLLSGFLVGHLAGNLFIFLGPEWLNGYAHHLKELGPLLWIARIGLLGLFIVHLGLAFSLWQRSQGARQDQYAYRDWRAASFASRTMILSGSVIFIFLLYHLAHFTIGVEPIASSGFKDRTHLDHVKHEVHDVYSMVIKGFQNPLVVGLYIAGQVLLGMHLSHGVSSAFKTLGLSSRKWQPVVMKIGPAFGFAIAAGNIAIPLACLFGIVQLPTGR
jgi:succinate dehydrogenase / fumarate reductase cytochrome b subunit